MIEFCGINSGYHEGVPENDPTQNLTPLLKQNLSPLKVGTNSVIKNAEILVLDTFLLD